MKRISPILLALIVWFVSFAAPAFASDDAAWQQLNGLVRQLNDRGAYTQAIEEGKRALQFADRAFGREDLRYATSLNNLGLAHAGIGHFQEAKALYVEAVAIREKANAPEDRESLVPFHNLALTCLNLGEYKDALAHFQRARTIATRVMGEGADETLLIASGVAQTLLTLNRQKEGEALLRDLLALAQRHHSPDAYRIAELHYLLGNLLVSSARYGEAEGHLKEALRIVEITIGLNHPSVASLVQSLGMLYGDTGRLPQARAFFDQARAIAEQHFGADSPLTATAYHNLAHVLWRIGDRDQSLRYYDKALTSFRKSLGPNHPNVATVLSDLSVAYQQSGRIDQALSAIEQAVKIREAALPPGHPDLGIAYNNLGYSLEHKGRLEEATAAYGKAIQVYERTYGDAHPRLATPLASLADLQVNKLGRATEAMKTYRRATSVLITRAQREAGATRALLEIEQNAYMFRNAIDVAWAVSDKGTRSDTLEEAYILSQWVQRTAASLALAQTGARLAASDPALAEVIRKRQDLVSQWQVLDKQLASTLGGAKGLNVERIGAARVGIVGVETTIARLDKEISEKFPNYASLTNAEPLTIRQTRQLIRPGEAILQFAVTQPHVYVWVITDTATHWARTDLTPADLGNEVAALRCGLDPAQWQSANTRDVCVSLLKGAQPRTEKVGREEVDVLPFDAMRAHQLYQRLLGQVEHLIKDKHLLIVPAPPLTSLPVHVLVTQAPQGEIPTELAEYRKIAWLAGRQAVTVLPSVTSLQSLRRLAQPSHASKKYLGVGNPLLDGPQDDFRWGEHWAKLAKAARTKQRCPNFATQQIASSLVRPPAGFDKLFRGGQTDIEEVRRWIPLPETADEVCEVGRRLGVPESEILLGSRATEKALKALSAEGRLRDYRILHFATHGALTGQVNGVAEPGLILTPPPVGTVDAGALDLDGGFLTASEIAGLKLDADWVILSACNTAGGGAGDSEAMSGMARAFFYAGARSLLVSHWEVQSHAAVKLTTRAFAVMEADASVGRAEALRRSMWELIAHSSALEAHPTQWAPFVVVGEGAK